MTLYAGDEMAYYFAMSTDIERDAYCFCCGADNEKGLHLHFDYPADGEAETALTVPDYFSGWKGVTHGGFSSMLLDEAMAHACLFMGETCVTVDLTIRYLKAIGTGTRVRVRGRLAERKGRILNTVGTIEDESGAACVEASARFLVMKGKPA